MTSGRYTPTAIALHWLLAVMIASAFCIGLYMADLRISPLRLKLYNWHKWLGMVVLALSVLRLMWRLSHKPPRPLPGPRWQTRVASVLHGTLYVLFFAVPVLGWAMSSASGFPVVPFGLIALPDLVAPNRDLADLLRAVHRYAAWTLSGMVLLHVAAAIKHQFIDRDGILERILPLRILGHKSS